MSRANDSSFERKYIFSTAHVAVNDFAACCSEKQTDPASHFVKNTMCSKVTDKGRISIYNDKLITTDSTGRSEELIPDEASMKRILLKEFNILIL